MQYQLRIMALACLIATVTSFSLFAQTRPVYQSGDWSIICNDGCKASQLLINEEKTLRYSATLSKTDNPKLLQIKLTFPLGLYLPANIAFKIGDLEKIIPVTTCLPSGCHALLLLDSKLQQMFSDNRYFMLRFFTTSDKENEIAYSLSGFSKALETIKN